MSGDNSYDCGLDESCLDSNGEVRAGRHAHHVEAPPIMRSPWRRRWDGIKEGVVFGVVYIGLAVGLFVGLIGLAALLDRFMR